MFSIDILVTSSTSLQILIRPTAPTLRPTAALI
jgi:hypothetical protein